MPRGRLLGFLFLFLALVLAGLILTDAWPLLRGPAPETSEWYWPYLLRPVARWWPSLLAAMMLAALGGWWLRREDDRVALPLSALILLNVALQLAFVYADRPAVGAELVDRTLSKASSGYLATAGEIDDLGDALRRFPELMASFDNDHARTHPPGFIAAHWLTDHALRRLPALAEGLARPATYWRCTDLWLLARPPATAASLLLWAWLPLLLGALTILPAYRLGRLWFGRVPARGVALFVATIPALLVFVPTPDQIFACLSLVSLLWLVVGLRDLRPIPVLAAGLTVSLMSFLSLGNAAWGALLGIYALWWALSPPVDQGFVRRRWTLVLIFAVGAAAFWLVYWLGWGVAPWAVAQVGLNQHYELVTSLRRYDWWLGSNLIDFALFVGPPVVVGLLWRAGETVRRREGRAAPDGRIALLLTALLLVIHLAGSTRGEVGRLWLVFMPAAAVMAGGLFARRSRDRLGLWLILVAQLVLALSIGLSWRTFYAVILPVERPEFAPAVPAAVADEVFVVPNDHSIRLIGYNLPRATTTAGGVLDLTLYWQADGPTLRPYTVFVQLLDSPGNIAAQQDGWPVEGRWPPTCWPAAETVPDPYTIELPAATPPGAYQLVIGLYDAASGGRLRTMRNTDFVHLVDITIKP